MNTADLKPATIEDLFQVTRRSANAVSKEVYIFEKESLDKVIGNDKAEELRAEFLKNDIKIKQITNLPVLPKFSSNDRFTNTCMSFIYVPRTVFDINLEILIFDDTVAIYCYQPEIKLLLIQDRIFAKAFMQLFLNVWEEGMAPKLGFDYAPNHSFYNSIDFFVEGKQMIIFPDKDAKSTYKGMDKEHLLGYLSKIYKQNLAYLEKSDYLIGFLWGYQGAKMLDLWKFETNYVDDRSGPLSECKVFKDGVEVTNIGTSSGNTLMVLGYEEKLRRSKRTLKEYLEGDPPKLPHEIQNGKDFFDSTGKV